jgi:hypothetical protein
VGVFVEDTEAQAREFMNTHPTTFPNGYDWALELARPLGFRGMPYTVIISPQGAVARRLTGPVSEADLLSAIEDLLRRG